jgi:H+-translocating NAD(P) transhydrogenase subunit beta
MSRAMNRSFKNVVFGAFGAKLQVDPAGKDAGGSVHEGTSEDAAELLKLAGSVIVVPGYGMAVAQAQHAVRDLADLLENAGTSVKYAIHPVAGRMPGHMNVLLAEANVSYDQLFELEAINDEFQRTDVPILNVNQSKAVIVLKRSMRPGFAGVENELFVQPNAMMVFGDAKKTLAEMVAALKKEG